MEVTNADSAISIKKISAMKSAETATITQTLGECDDGSQIPGDGCDDSCRVERGW
jgi:cysteine-rich repeat protein